MSDLKRIDPAAVAAWFKAHPEIEPVRGVFVRYAGRREQQILTGCCGLSSQALESGPDLAPLESIGVLQGVPTLATALALDPSYAHGFTAGWDDFVAVSQTLPGFNRQAFEVGYGDGLDAYRATTEALS